MKTVQQSERKSPVKVTVNKELDKIDISKSFRHKRDKVNTIIAKGGLPNSAKG